MVGKVNKMLLGDKIKKSLKTIIIIIVIVVTSCRTLVKQEIPINDPVQLAESSGKQFNLLTYNVQAIFGKDEKKLKGLCEYINREGFDFVVLQEVFNEDTREYLMNGADSNKYLSFVPKVEYNTFPESLLEDAGLFLKSKYPQIDLSNINFGRSVEHSYGAIHKILTKEFSPTTDFLANKSVLGSLHNIGDSNFVFLFTTHLQAIGTKFHRRTQLRQIRRFIEGAVYFVLKNEVVKDPGKLVVLLAGDFNVNAYTNGDLNMMLKFLGNPRELHTDFRPEQPEFTMSLPFMNFQVRFDFIFAYDKVGPVELNKVNVNSINVTNIVDEENRSISDHYALKASLSIGP